MKNSILLIVLFALTPLFGYSQIDSAAVKIDVTVQARDAEYIASFASFNPHFEDFFDKAKSKFRVTTSPSGNSVVSVENVPIKEWLTIANYLRTDYLAVHAGVSARLDVLLRAKGNLYINRLLDEELASGTLRYMNARQEGRRKLRQAIN